MTNKKFPRKPWITPGLMKSCNKKNKNYTSALSVTHQNKISQNTNYIVIN